jgi:ankyrin repeat protein
MNIQNLIEIQKQKGASGVAHHLKHSNIDLNSKDISGHTLLHHAVIHNEIVIAECLIRGGADVNATTNVIEQTGKTISGYTALHLAVDNENKGMVETLLIHSANVNAQTDVGETPLHLATIEDQSDIAEVLINYGANIETQTLSKKETPLHYAVSDQQTNTTTSLLKKFANVNAINADGNTPLHLALGKDMLDCDIKTAEILLEHGADVNISNRLGETAVGIIKKRIEDMQKQAQERPDKDHDFMNALRNLQYLYHKIENQQLKAEVKRLKAENEKLKAQSEQKNPFERKLTGLF